MNVYREHIAPPEPQNEYIARIEQENREQAEQRKSTLPPRRHATIVDGNGPLAPGRPLHCAPMGAALS